MKELDSSPNASKAFEIIKLQEQSKQKEYQTEIERAQTQRTQMGLQRAQVPGPWAYWVDRIVRLKLRRSARPSLSNRTRSGGPHSRLALG